MTHLPAPPIDLFSQPISHPTISTLFEGNFVDLVSKKWYDGMPLQKVEQLTVQTGKPVGGEGYTDPKTKEVR